MKLFFVLAVAALLAGCSSPEATAGNVPISVHVIHRFHESNDPDSFEVPRGAALANVTVIIENFYRNRCPAPIGEVTLKDPRGATFAQLRTENIPLSDCVYKFERNETALLPGTWTIHYSGGSEHIGSIVDVRTANATQDVTP